LLEGLDSQGCQKLVCGYGDVLGYTTQVFKKLEEKKNFYFLRQYKFFWSLKLKLIERIFKPCPNYGLEKFINFVTTYEK
jgi:hypothetical protein